MVFGVVNGDVAKPSEMSPPSWFAIRINELSSLPLMLVPLRSKVSKLDVAIWVNDISTRTLDPKKFE